MPGGGKLWTWRGMLSDEDILAHDVSVFVGMRMSARVARGLHSALVFVLVLYTLCMTCLTLIRPLPARWDTHYPHSSLFKICTHFQAKSCQMYTAICRKHADKGCHQHSTPSYSIGSRPSSAMRSMQPCAKAIRPECDAHTASGGSTRKASHRPPRQMRVGQGPMLSAPAKPSKREDQSGLQCKHA